jgi:hypothetical protein
MFHWHKDHLRFLDHFRKWLSALRAWALASFNDETPLNA